MFNRAKRSCCLRLGLAFGSYQRLRLNVALVSLVSLRSKAAWRPQSVRKALTGEGRQAAKALQVPHFAGSLFLGFASLVSPFTRPSGRPQGSTLCAQSCLPRSARRSLRFAILASLFTFISSYSFLWLRPNIHFSCNIFSVHFSRHSYLRVYLLLRQQNVIINGSVYSF